MANAALDAARRSAADMNHWLREDAWRIWLDHGIDWCRGGFHEHLSSANLTCDATFRRLRVSARQIYVFSQAMQMGTPGAEDAVELGLRAIRAHFAMPEGGYAARCDLRGRIIDGWIDLYDQAFVLLALAAAFAARPSARLRTEALALLDFLETSLRHPSGVGFQEGLPAHLPRRQNPHMHWLEALLAAAESFREVIFLERAAELVDLFLGALFQLPEGALPETFDDAWRPLRDNGRFLVEPGHHAEWIWLLGRFEALVHDRPDLHAGCQAAAAVFRQFNETCGRASGSQMIVDAVWSDGSEAAGGCSLWPQAEVLKAEACRPDSQADRVVRAYENLSQFLLPEPSGLWRERLNPGSQDDPGITKASSLYHLTSAILCAGRSLGHAAEPAAE